MNYYKVVSKRQKLSAPQNLIFLFYVKFRNTRGERISTVAPLYILVLLIEYLNRIFQIFFNCLPC